jgi:hypothetical protein
MQENLDLFHLHSDDEIQRVLVLSHGQVVETMPSGWDTLVKVVFRSDRDWLLGIALSWVITARYWFSTVTSTAINASL